VTIATVVTGAGVLNKSGTGTLVLPSSNNFSGGSKVNAGTLITGTTLSLGTGTATLNGGTLSLQITSSTSAVQSPITLTAASYNEDVIWSKQEFDPGVGTSTTWSGAVVFYELGQPWSVPGSGLPTNGLITQRREPDHQLPARALQHRHGPE